MIKNIILFFVLSAFLTSCRQDPATEEYTDFEQELQQKLNAAKEGDVIELPEGKFDLQRTLFIKGSKNVTIRGKGKELTVLTFRNQKEATEGLNISADGIVIEDLAVLDAKSDIIRVLNSRNVALRRLKLGYSITANKQASSSAIHGVDCGNILMEDCDLFGSGLAGITVDHSQNVVIRRSHIFDNQTGCRIVNCTDADVQENRIEKNSLGVLAMSQPNPAKKGTVRCRLFNNHITDNTRPLAEPRDSVIASGAGILLVAVGISEIYGNEIVGHNTFSIAMVSLKALKATYSDSLNDPFCMGISIHDNKIERGSGIQDNVLGLFQGMNQTTGEHLADILYDGSDNPAYHNPDGSIKNDYRICIHNNPDATFMNLDLPGKGAKKSADLTRFDCSHASLHGVKLN